ncbi:serine/threonine protein kinase, partial [Rhodopirellula bahusiensis]
MIATSSSACLSEQEIRAFSAGRLPEQRFGDALEHLDVCPECQQRAVVGTDDSDPLFAALAQKSSSVDDPILAEPDCQVVLMRALTRRVGSLDGVMPPIEMLGPYRLIRPLGCGGMGAVYLAEHQRLRRQCAVKLLPKERGLDPDWLQRFEREMQAVASLQHPNIVAATDAGDACGWHYLVMEYLDGLDLAAVVRRLGPLSTGMATTIMREVCQALAALHAAGLVHRDVKPSNVMLTRGGQVKLLDLGLVFDGQAAANLRVTTVGHVLGTLVFAAPEQLSNQSTVDQRADLYGVGATLFQLLCGESAHQSNQGVAPLVIEKTTQPARSLSSVVPSVPEDLNQVVADLLQRQAADRPSSAAEVADSLVRFADDPELSDRRGLKRLIAQALRNDDPEPPAWSTAAVPAPDPSRSPPRRFNRTWMLGLGGCFLCLLAAIVVTIQTDRGTLVIESPQDDLQIEIVRGDQAVEELEVETGGNAITLRSGTYNVRLKAKSDGITLSHNQVTVRRGEETVVQVHQSTSPVTELTAEAASTAGKGKLFQGLPLSHWVRQMEVERDVDTLVVAMNAIAGLVDSEDVDAAHAILRASRRLGGWVAGTNDSSGRFMEQINDPFRQMFPQPGIAAISRELPESNASSRAACLWLLNHFYTGESSYSSLYDWAEEQAAKSLPAQPKRLHDRLQELLQAAGNLDSQSHAAAIGISLQLAIAMQLPLRQEHGLEEHLRGQVTKLTAESDLKIPLKKRFGWLRDELAKSNVEKLSSVSYPHLNPWEILAAIELGIDMNSSLLVNSLLFDVGNWNSGPAPLQNKRNRKYWERLESDSETIADETIVWLATYNPQMAGGNQHLTNTLCRNEGFWIKTLPLISQHTGDPSSWTRLLRMVRVPEDAKDERWKPTQGSGEFWGTASPELHSAVQQAIEIAEQRVQDNFADRTLEDLRSIQLPDSADPLYEADSPDARYIAFVGSVLDSEGQRHGLFCYDRILSDLQLLIPEALKTRPAWSPDSKQLSISRSCFCRTFRNLNGPTMEAVWPPLGAMDCWSSRKSSLTDDWSPRRSLGGQFSGFERHGICAGSKGLFETEC